ncbi:hypothetical protein LIA77_04538 [Sarocladium implicatum]|nr:hypothetical protein LIA77_04538 [Sarocladium implicatum]
MDEQRRDFQLSLTVASSSHGALKHCDVLCLWMLRMTQEPVGVSQLARMTLAQSLPPTNLSQLIFEPLPVCPRSLKPLSKVLAYPFPRRPTKPVSPLHCRLPTSDPSTPQSIFRYLNGFHA